MSPSHIGNPQGFLLFCFVLTGYITHAFGAAAPRVCIATSADYVSRRNLVVHQNWY
jgi:hypothetical protein